MDHILGMENICCLQFSSNHTIQILFGFFTIPEYFVDQLVESFPIYFAVKLILLLVLFLPQFQVKPNTIRN